MLPSVVRIEVETGIGSTAGAQRIGEGSRFVWSENGHVVTNHHVIENADRVTIIFADGTEVNGKVLGSDPDSDLAMLIIFTWPPSASSRSRWVTAPRSESASWPSPSALLSDRNSR